MRQLPELHQLSGMARGAVYIADQNLAAATVGAFDSFRQSFTDGNQKSGSFGGTAQRPNLVARLHRDTYIENAAFRSERLGNFHSFHRARRKNQEAVVSSSPARRLELAGRHSARHAASFDEFI